MKLGSKHAVQKRKTRMERLRDGSSGAQTLRVAFPSVGKLRIELAFGGSAPGSPVPQVLELHPAARAFFVYPCPYSSCDGTFDLAGAVATAVESGVRSSRGMLVCAGVRSRTQSIKEPCLLQLDFEVKPVYESPPRKKSSKPG